MVDRGSRLRWGGDRSGWCRHGNRRWSGRGLLDGCLNRLRGLLDRCLDRLRRRRVLDLGLCLGLSLGLGLLGLSSGMRRGSAALATSGRGRGRCWLRSRLLLDLLGFIFHLRRLDSGRLWRMLLQRLL